MKKFLLSIFCCLMAVFSVQAEEVTKNVTFSDYTAGTQYAANEEHDLGDGLVIYTTECHFTTQLRIYSSSSHNGYVVSDALPGTITKMTFNAGNKVDKLDIYGSNDGTIWNLVGQVSVTSTSYKDYSFDFSGSYNRFKLDVNGDQQIRIAAMSVTYTTGEGGDTPVVPTLSKPTFTPADGTAFDESMEVAIEAEEGTTIYYTTNGDEPSTTSAVYTEPFTITETTIVKAYAVKDGSNDSSVATATYTKKTIVAGNWNLVSNVAELSAGDEVVIVAADYDFALSATQNTNNRAQAEVQKEGNAIKFSNDVQVITLEDGNVEGTFAFNTGAGYLYAASSSSNHLRTEETLSDNSSWSIAIANGVATIVAQGTNTRNTMQYNQSGKLFACYGSASQKAVSIYKNFEEGEEPVVVPAAPVISTPEGVTNFEESIVVTISAESGMTIYYTTDGNAPTDASDVYSAPLEITETTTVKAIAVNGEGVSSAVASSKYTKVAASVEGTVADAIAAYVDGYEIPATITGYIVGAVDGSINKAENFTGETTVAANILIADDANETDATKCIPVQLSSGAFRTALNLAANTGNYKKKITVSGDLTAYFGVAGIKNVNAAGVYQTVSNVGWSTLYLGYNAVVPNTVKAYVATEIVSNSVILEQIEGTIDAETGVILEGAGEHLFNVASEAAGNEKGLLKGSVAAENVTPEGTAYVLSAPAGVVGLYIAELAEGAFLNNANKAYLDVTSSDAAASYSFNFDWNGTTAVEGVVAEGAENGAIYDITGRRVKAITAAGIYIVNGRKVVK